VFKVLTILIKSASHLPLETMSYGPLISEVICKGMVFFNVVSIQARLTSRFTPAFSRNLEEKLPEHKRVLFSWAGVSDSGLRAFFVGLNVLLAVLLWVPSFRTLGLWIGFGLCFLGLYSDLQLKESFIPHTTLFLLCSGALWLAE
jgi:hypothetical protein